MPIHSELISAIERGDETTHLFRLVIQQASTRPGVVGAALVMQPDRANSPLEVVECAGHIPLSNLPEVGQSKLPYSVLWSNQYPGMEFFPVNSLGSPIGYMAVRFERYLEQNDREALAVLAHHASCIYDRHRLSESLQLFLSRLEVMNELTQLIVSNASVKDIAKALCREAKLRFQSDTVTVLTLDETRQHLLPLSGLGLTSQQVPEQLSAKQTWLEKELALAQVQLNDENWKQHFYWLDSTGATTAHLGVLRTRRELVGLLVLGYQKKFALDRTMQAKLSEFSQGAAVALANAKNYEQLSNYSSKLEDIVAQRTAELAVKIADAEENSRQKTQFISNISHEFRTPLTGILGYASILLDGLYGDLNKEQREALESVSKSAEHLKSLVDEILSLARVESGKEKAEPAAVHVGDVLKQLHKLVLQTAIGKGVALQTIEFADKVEDDFLWVDRRHVNQIIINLLSNAIKYTPKGGKVWLKSSRKGDKVQISVSDTGVGISQQKLENLFERFERGEDSYSKNQEGTGIGLNLTRTLIEMNGGLIEVTSEIGQGSTFSVILPKATGNILLLNEKGDAQEIKIHGLRLLLVDDSPDAREVVGRILRAAGAEVTLATSANEGIDLIERNTLDVILTDISMPESSGLELIRNIRNNGSAKANIPIVVLSAHALDRDREAAMSAGASEFISKPCSPHEILQCIRNVTLVEKS